MKKRILILINSTRISGAEISLLSLLQRLDRQKYELYLGAPAGELYEILASFDHPSVVPFDLRRFTVRKGLPGLISSLFRMLATSIRISLFVHEKGIDIVYANSTQAMVYCFPVRMLTFKKVIWHVRDTLNNKIAVSILSWSAARVICVSGFIFDQLPIKLSKKEVIYNGLDIAVWSPSVHRTNFLKADLGLGNDVVLVGQIGQLIPWKNHTDIIRVAELVITSFKDVHFVIIGDDLFGGNEKYIEQLKDNIRVRDLEKHISLIGHRKNIRDYIGCLDIVLHSSKNEPFGRVIIEGMALEKPVISYDSGGPKEIIAHQVTGFLAGGDVGSMASSLLLLLKDAELRRTFGKAGRQRVEEVFSLGDHAGRIASVLDTLE